MSLQTIPASEREPFRQNTAIRAIIEVLNTSATLSANAGQIAFPATQNPSTNANTLDDYEEGAWTPAIAAGTPGDLNIVYGNQFGRYTKIGRTVIAHFNIGTSTFTHTTASGQATITGLPFDATEDFVGTLIFSGITKATFTQFAPVTATNDDALAIECSGTGVAIASLQITDLPTAGTKVLRGTVIYETDE